MKLLFLTTKNLYINNEHPFTKNVCKYLSQYYTVEELVFCSCIIDEQRDSYYEEEKKIWGKDYHILYTSSKGEEKNLKILFQSISPSIIHSNMVEGTDIIVAKNLGIPIILTIHIGGIICPRGGVNGFLMYNDHICNSLVGKNCLRCISKDLPFSAISYFFEKIIPDNIKKYLSNKIKKNYFYITAFLRANSVIDNRLARINLFKYATLIAANPLLVNLLNKNGLYNVKLIGHGVCSREKISIPPIRKVVKFYYLGRIQYSKGLHNVIKAFDKISNDSYELHIIGNAGNRLNDKIYYSRVRRLAWKKNIFFHGECPNEQIESLIRDYHVMIFPTICLEVYGIAISESLSMGRPVLATKCGGAEMQIKDGYNGWLVSPNDIFELQTKIKEIINNPTEIYRCAENCTNPVSIGEYICSLDKLYNETEI